MTARSAMSLAGSGVCQVSVRSRFYKGGKSNGAREAIYMYSIVGWQIF
jgi:hypothetical protein